ncbi:MAG: hypothetical protein AB1427_20255 [Thermodesulfobacteriota bacterium]
MPLQHCRLFIAGFVSFIALVCFIRTSDGADPMLSQIQSLMQEMETIKQELATADEEKIILDKEERTLIQTGELIKEAEKNYKTDRENFLREWNNDQDDIARHNAEKNKSDDPAWIKAYNERATSGNAYTAQLKEKGKTLEERKKVINERRGGLNTAVNEWARKKKENNAKLNALQARYEFQVKMIRSLTVLPAGRMLIQNAGASQECADIPGIENLEKQLNGAAERAHRCLQKIWDGAK